MIKEKPPVHYQVTTELNNRTLASVACGQYFADVPVGNFSKWSSDKSKATCLRCRRTDVYKGKK